MIGSALEQHRVGVQGSRFPWDRHGGGERRWPIPLGVKFPSCSSFSRNGPEGVGGPLFPGTPTPPSFWVGGAVEGSGLSPGPGKTPIVRGHRVLGMLTYTCVPAVSTVAHATHVIGLVLP